MSIHDDMHDVAVIGAGAAGLAASIFAAEAAAKGDPRRTIELFTALINVVDRERETPGAGLAALTAQAERTRSARRTALGAG